MNRQDFLGIKDKQDRKKAVWNAMLAGVISTVELLALSGQRAYRPGMGRVYSKYTPRQMQEMRLRGHKVRNDATNEHTNAMHRTWYIKKFGQAAFEEMQARG